MTSQVSIPPSKNQTKEATIAARPYYYRLRGWLPEHKNSKILDLGCGTGNISSLFTKKFDHVVGVDLNQHKLENALRLGLITECAEVIEFLSQNQTAYDVICAFDLIEHLEKSKIKLFLELCFKNLNPGGRLILQLPNPISPFGYGVVQGDLTHQFPISPVLAKNLLHEIGFTNCEWRETGPSLWGYSISSTLRFLIWRLIRLKFRFIHFIEAGERDNFPLTRVFLISGKRASVSHQN